MDSRGSRSKESPLDGEMKGDRDAQANAAERMRQAIAAVSKGGGSRAELQHAAQALVTELRRREEPPEQALVQIKAILAEAGLRPSYGSPGDGAAVTSGTSVYRDVIAWSIRAYYDGRDGKDGTGDK